MALFEAGRDAEAESACARSVAIGLARFGEDDTMVANIRFVWGTNLLERERPDDAVPLITSALAVQRRVYGDDHPHVAGSTLALGMAQLAHGDVAAAERTIRRGIELCAGVGASCSIAALLHLGQVLETKGDLDGALAAIRRAEVELPAVAAADTYLGSVVGGALGAVLLVRGEIDLAIPELERAHASCLALFGSDHQRTRNAALSLAQAQDELRARSREAARR
jgi:tetratricopeptide (TPR) repeat protein